MNEIETYFHIQFNHQIVIQPKINVLSPVIIIMTLLLGLDLFHMVTNATITFSRKQNRIPLKPRTCRYPLNKKE